jgi:hypothetical protein
MCLRGQQRGLEFDQEQKCPSPGKGRNVSYISEKKRQHFQVKPIFPNPIAKIK